MSERDESLTNSQQQSNQEDRRPLLDRDASGLAKGHSENLPNNMTISMNNSPKSWLASLCSIKVGVLLILCFQNSMFTLLRRYSQGVLKEAYSKYEVLLVGEVIKMVFSALMIAQSLPNKTTNSSSSSPTPSTTTTISFKQHLRYIIRHSHKMLVLALIYGAMNILSFVSLRNIGAGMFTIFAQCKILTTATFSTLLLKRRYSATQWRALVGLLLGVLLFSEPIWNATNPTHKDPIIPRGDQASAILGIVAVVTEVILSGFASIYFEKVIKQDPLQLTIWERNFQLALTSFPVYLLFIAADGGTVGGGWSGWTVIVALLGAAGGLLVALSIKYADAILKTLATTGAIVLSSVLDHAVLGGPLTPTMCIAGAQVILAIFDYSFDQTPKVSSATAASANNAANNSSSIPLQDMRNHKNSRNNNNDIEAPPQRDVPRTSSKSRLDDEAALVRRAYNSSHESRQPASPS